MYARKENSEIKRYNELPKALWNGVCYITVTEENAAALGFKPLAIPEFDARTHKRSGIIIETESGFEYEVVSLNKSVDDLKAELLRELKGYWKIAFEEGKPYSDFLKATNQDMPTDVQTEINNAYTLLSTIKGQINALSTVEAAAAYEFPMTDINAALDYMRDLI